MDDFMTKADDLFPTQTQTENPTLQPNGLNAQRVRATNKRCASATREDKNPDRTRNSQQQVIHLIINRGGKKGRKNKGK